MNLSYLWPIGLVIFSNVVYQICAKSVPAEISPMASLTVTYLVAAVCSAILHYVMGGSSILNQYAKLNWAPFLLGLVIVGLEVGTIYAYRAGWTVSTEMIVQSSIVGILLIFVGWLLYHEAITPSKVLGIVICLVGLYFINR